MSKSTLTISQDGVLLSETVDGINMPIDYGFASVNDWIHGIDVQFEEIQALCLGMASEIGQLKQKLSDQSWKFVKRHDGVVGFLDNYHEFYPVEPHILRKIQADAVRNAANNIPLSKVGNDNLSITSILKYADKLQAGML